MPWRARDRRKGRFTDRNLAAASAETKGSGLASGFLPVMGLPPRTGEDHLARAGCAASFLPLSDDGLIAKPTYRV
jgi:hypothetical protein